MDRHRRRARVFEMRTFPKPKIIEFRGEAHTVREWALKLGMNQSSLSERLITGWPLERALSPKTRKIHVLNEPTKCTKCDEIYPWSDEYFTPRHNKFSPCEQPCKKCTKIVRAKSDARKASRKAYYQAHYDEALSYAKEWYRSNPDKVRANSKSYYKTHRKEIIAAATKWNKAHPINGRLHGQRRRTRMAEQCGTLSRHDIELQYKNQRGRCWWCSVKLKGNYQIDHRIPLSRGGKHDKANIVIACPRCNNSKGAKLPHEWIGRLL